MSKTKGVIIIESQPPHMGELLQIINQLNKYDFIYVCIESPPMVIPLRYAIAVWMMVLKAYEPRIQIVTVEKRFNEVMADELPEVFDDCVYITTSRDTFAHLSSMNIDVELVPMAHGYYGIFERVAYRQSRALNWLESKVINSMQSIFKK